MKTFAYLFLYLFFTINFMVFSQIQQTNKLVPDENGRWFGSSIVTEGDLVVIGCPYDNTNGEASGSVYIYDLLEDTHKKIIGTDVAENDQFGLSIAIDDQTIVVGAPHKGTYWEGAVYIFRKNTNGEWVEEAKLTKSTATEQFGRGVSIDGDQLMIATDHDNAYIYSRKADNTWVENTVISDLLYPRFAYIKGNYAAVCDPAGFSSEYVNIYHKADTVWSFLQTISVIEGQGQVAFGQSIVIKDDYLIIGSPRHGTIEYSAIIVGAVYVYKLNNNMFELETILFRSNIHQQSYFGTSVDISDNVILVGASQFYNNGAAFLYQKIGDDWIELSDTIKADDGGNSDSFGSAVAISSNNIIIGAPRHNPIDFLNSYGAAYIFENGYVTDLEDAKNKGVPSKFSLSQNYPNPFNPSTTIKYQLPVNVETFIRLNVFDVLGRHVKTLVNENQKPGNYEVTFDGSMISNGVYFYQLSTGNYVETRKMLMIK